MAYETINLTVGLCQFSSIPGDIEANLKLIEECCIKATSGAADLFGDKITNPNRAKPDILVFPELATVGYYAGLDAHRELAETTTGSTAERLQQLAQQFNVGLLVGLVERDPLNSDTIYDAALCIDAKGTVVGTYRKAHLFPETESYFTQGNSIQPIKFNNINVGVMICADMRSPETARSLTVQGAQILIGLTHWRHDNQQERERLLPARAVENFLPLIDVNAMSEGSDPGDPYGNSLAFDERGNEELRLDKNSNGIVVGLTTLCLYPSGKHSRYGEQHFQRRKELYAPLIADNISGIHVSSSKGGTEEAALNPLYVAFLRIHDEQFKSVLTGALAAFPKAGTGYIGLVDDLNNLQIRCWVGGAGAFIMLRANEGTAGYSLRTGKCYRWRGDANTTDDPYFVRSDSKVRSELVAPIRLKDGVAGVILLDSHDESCFDEDDAEVKLLAHAGHLAHILSQAPESPKSIGLAQRPQEVEEVVRIASSLLDKSFVDNKDAAQDMAKRILASAMEITKAMRGNIAMVDDGWLKIVARQGDGTEHFVDIDLKAKRTGIKGWVIRNKKPFYAPNVKGNPEKGYRPVEHYIATHESVLSELAVPLKADNGEAIGVINLESDKEHAFDVILSDPAKCESITGGRDYILFSALAVFGARLVAISKQHEKFKEREEAAKKTALEHSERFEQALIALNRVAVHSLLGNVSADFSKLVSNELSKMLQDPAMRPAVSPIYGQDFLDRCLAVNLPATIKIDQHLLGGGFWRTSSPLMELAVIELIYHAQAVLLQFNVDKPRIEICLNLRSDPVRLSVSHTGTAETEATNLAFKQESVDQQQLDEGMATVLRIALWHKGELIKESHEHGGCSYHILIPRSYKG